jgi:crotonobetainyl-CoA:carnitine CoA-transferase CaiB-like acyl-CoA transferase
MTALKGFRIVELAERPAGEFCGKLLSDFGAELVKVERPGCGSPTRAMAPRVRNDAGVESSGLFAWLNTNKKSVALDLRSEADVGTLHELTATADAVIDDHDEDWLRSVRLTPEEVARAHPAAVLCSITPYGHGAPRSWWNAKPLNVFHRSGWGFHTASLDLSRPPLKGPGRFLVDYEAALDAALCVASSLYWRGQTGSGQFVDVAELEVMVSRADIVAGRMIAGEDESNNKRTAFSQGGPHAYFACEGGTVYLYMTSRKHWAGLRALMGDPDWARKFDDNWLEFKATPDAVAECRARFAEWVRPMNKDDASAKAQQLGVPLVPVNDAGDLQRSPQFEFRNFFRRLKHPVLGETLYPTVPYKLSASPAELVTPAPALGEHGIQALGGRSSQPLPGKGAEKKPANTSRGGPLAGVRVLELTKVWAGPYAGKLLAFLGAEVIKVESNSNPDEMRVYGGVDPNHAPYFLSLNPEVLSVQINLKSEAGLEQLRRLVAQSDIVLNNLRPGAMERMGLGYERMCAIKHDIISVSMKMWGNDGPLGYQTGYAPCFAALAGLNYLVGYEGERPIGINMRYGDSTVGANAAFAAIVALLHRERTGEGQFVDVSAVECMSSMVGDSLFEFSLTGRVPGPDGNVHADMAPHGCYPCLGEEWVSIAIGSDEEWKKFCAAVERPELATDPLYATFALRQTHRRQLDEVISALTGTQDAKTIAARLRDVGVSACKSQSSQDLINDEFLWGRDFFRFVSDRKEGSRPIVGAPWRMSKAIASISRGAPDLGEHNVYVYREILGVSSERLAQMIKDKIVD